ncbi:phytoene/squalene synthase family protein [Caenimonas koreensis]|uniref:phytoene/squalene synthase family protein n=1 Tax=Caenimonas koreensis TaxID=367474 RepID=UPI003783782B
MRTPHLPPDPPSTLPPPLPPQLLDLLKSVSRSFYLSIRLLPAGLRQPVAIAYLLARASDTIADTSELPARERAAMLELFMGLIEGMQPPGSVEDISAWFAPFQRNEDEHALMVALPQCFAWMAQLGPQDLDAVREVLASITRGQQLDVERFGEPATIASLQSPGELDEYTWLVAGSVGEFWTRMCFRHLPDFSNLPEERMLELAKSYGKGLQLVNILRDVGEDLAAGRCYLPAHELAAAGVAPGDRIMNAAALQPVWQKWLHLAQQRLDDGMLYASAVKPRRVRAASALPALLGARTLALLRADGLAGAMAHRVKMDRTQVQGLLLRLALTLASPASLAAQYRRMGQGQ